MNPSAVTIHKAVSLADAKNLAALAASVWTQHFTPIIGAAQVRYMLDKFQSATAIQAQMNSGATYFYAQVRDAMVGYMCLIPNKDAGSVMLSKLYVTSTARGCGVGCELLNFAVEFAQKTDRYSLWLTVNRDNGASVAWYQRRGFIIVRESKTDIGGGFFMDDFVMELALAPKYQTANILTKTNINK